MDFSMLGKDPISAAKPSGEDVHYDALFDQLQREVDRACQPSLAGAVDWESVIEVAGEILSRKSKDLLVAGYLAVGLIHTRGIEGLELGLTILNDLLQHHGPALFPLRQRGRLRAVEWWLEKSETALKPLENSFSLSPGQWRAMEEKLASVGQLLKNLLPEAPPLTWLGNFLQRAEQSTLGKQTPQAALQNQAPVVNSRPAAGSDDLPKPSTEPAASVAAMADCPGSQGDNSGAGGSLPSSHLPIAPPAPSARSREAVEEAFRRLRESAETVRSEDMGNPLPYRLSRQAAWLDVRELPPASGKRTLLPPPPATLRNRLADLQSSPDRSQSISESEGQLGQFIFWLDLNRLSAQALQELGAQQAAAAVRQETLFLLQRLPGLDELTFADGTPFADAQTRKWLGGDKRTGSPPPAMNKVAAAVAATMPAPGGSSSWWIGPISERTTGSRS